MAKQQARRSVIIDGRDENGSRRADRDQNCGKGTSRALLVLKLSERKRISDIKASSPSLSDEKAETFIKKKTVYEKEEDISLRFSEGVDPIRGDD